MFSKKVRHSSFHLISHGYRIAFGPPAQNRKKIGKYRKQPSPGSKIGLWGFSGGQSPEKKKNWGGPELTLFERDSIENPQFGGQNPSFPRATLGGELPPPSSVRYVLTPPYPSLRRTDLPILTEVYLNRVFLPIRTKPAKT